MASDNTPLTTFLNLLGSDTSLVLSFASTFGTAKLGESDVPQEVDATQITYVNVFESGLCFALHHGKLHHIFFFLESYDRFFPFRSSVDGIDTATSRSDIRKKLGTPICEGSSKIDPLLGNVNSWDKFSLQNSYVHIEYSLMERPVKITIGRA